jgi:hypothetical protein
MIDPCEAAINCIFFFHTEKEGKTPERKVLLGLFM